MGGRYAISGLSESCEILDIYIWKHSCQGCQLKGKRGWVKQNFKEYEHNTCKSENEHCISSRDSLMHIQSVIKMSLDGSFKIF